MGEEADILDREYGGEYIGNAMTYAMEHKYVLQKYNRLPERNLILGRPSTPDEVEYC